MSELERLAGSLLCIGFPGARADDALLERLRALGPGGVVLFSRNVTSIDATRELVDALQAALAGDSPLSVGIDQEGGRVARIVVDPPFPAAMALGAAEDVALAERAGRALALTVEGVGANVKFMPVLDLALDPRSTVIGTRSLGDDPARVAALGAALVRGLQAVGVAATPKHFPGHGATPVDSHVALPVVATDEQTLRTRELVPFVAAFAAGARAVMSAHVLLPALDATLPATLSPRILRGLLREELGFKGVCFTDCLEMHGVSRRFGRVRAGVLALAAGADVLLVSHDLAIAEALRDGIVAAVRDGELPFARVEEAAQRVAAFRNAHPPPRPADDDSATRSAQTAREVAARAIALVRGNVRLAQDRPVTIVSFEGASHDGISSVTSKRPSLNLALRRRHVRSELLRVALDPDVDMVGQLIDVLVAQGSRAVVVLSRRAHLHAAQRSAIDALLLAFPELILVSMLEPFDVPAFPAARRVACTFGDEASSVDALADVLVGRAPATARLPVALEAGVR